MIGFSPGQNWSPKHFVSKMGKLKIGGNFLVKMGPIFVLNVATMDGGINYSRSTSAEPPVWDHTSCLFGKMTTNFNRSFPHIKCMGFLIPS